MVAAGLMLAFAGREVVERVGAPQELAPPGADPAKLAQGNRLAKSAVVARRAPLGSSLTAVETRPSARAPGRLAADRCLADRIAAIDRYLDLRPVPATAREALAEAALRLPDNAAWLDAALRRWPRDVDAAWMAWQFCGLSTNCDPDARVRHLLDVDGDNAYAWLTAVDAANARHDAGGVAISLRKAASASVYDDRAGTVYVIVRPLLAAQPLPGSCQRGGLVFLREMLGREPTAGDVADILAHNYETGLRDAGYSLTSLCDGRKRSLSSARKRDCIAVLKRRVDSDALDVRHASLRSLIPLLDLQDSAPLREQLRQLLWLKEVMATQQDHIGPMLGGQFWSKGEVPAYEAIARKDGLWPPPPQWLPDASHDRRLILEGR